jgi:cytoskeletal protein CcmA (bactofilin family)
MAKGQIGEGTMNTLVGSGTVIEGKLKVASSMRVDGKIMGDVTCQESLLVGKTGVVEASIKVKSATIGGKVSGNIEAQDVVVLEGKSTLVGDVTTRKLIIEEGAVFNGTCRMEGEGVSRVVSSPAPTAPGGGDAATGQAGR